MRDLVILHFCSLFAQPGREKAARGGSGQRGHPAAQGGHGNLGRRHGSRPGSDVSAMWKWRKRSFPSEGQSKMEDDERVPNRVASFTSLF